MTLRLMRSSGEIEACEGGGDEAVEVLLDAGGSGTTPRAGTVFAKHAALAFEDLKERDFGFGVFFGEGMGGLIVWHRIKGNGCLI